MKKMFNIQLAVIVLIFVGFSGKSDAKLSKGRLLTPEEGCGFTKVTVNRIVGGSNAKNGAWPWIAQLGYKSILDKTKLAYKCGGTLITSRHVLTAAHCIQDSLMQVRLGEFDTSKTDDGPTVDVDVERVESHPRFNKPYMTNDIAIVYLKNDVEFTDRIRPVCLPLDPPLSELNLVGSNPFVIGWGRQNASSALSGSEILKQVQLPIHDNSLCVKVFKKVHIYVSPLQFDESAICAGNLAGGHDSCKGDSGGPMMIPIQKAGQFSFYQFGIVSYGKECALPDMPSIYSRVSHHSDWIKEQLAK